MLDVIEKHTEVLEKTVNEKTRDLIENQEKLKSILNASPDAIIATDLDSNILDCNPQMTNLSGFDRNELIGKSALQFIDEKDSHHF
jgi:PAS domain S-box-containing protein